MTRIFGHYVPLEMMLLWLIELTLCFGIGYAASVAASGTTSGAASGSAATDIAAVLAISAGLTSFAIGLYRPETFLHLSRLMAKTGIAAVLSFPAFWILGHLAGLDLAILLGDHGGLAGALLPLKMLASWIALIVAIRLAFSYSLRMQLFTRRVVIIGSGPAATRTAAAIDRLHNGLFEVAGTLRGFDPSADGSENGDGSTAAGRMLAQLRRRKVWGVVVADAGADAGANGDPAHASAHAALASPSARREGRGVAVWNGRDFWEGQLRRVDIDQIDDVEAIRRAARASRFEALVRRATDIGLSLFLLAFTLPLMVLTALAIRLDSPGPIFYRQTRLGLGNVPFVLCKFRSMRTDAEASGPVWASLSDSRVTRVGAFIRRTRIDELPQLMNVLSGAMSFIGPRPERPHFVEQLAAQIPFYAERAAVKPGLTGWAQVNYPYGASVEDTRMKLSYDLWYVKHHSLFLDVLILFATVRVILFQEGAR